MTATNTTVRLDEATRAKLDRIAKHEDRSRAWVISEAIRQYLAHQEWMLAQIEEGIAQADRGELIPHDEVMSELEAMITKKIPVAAKN